MEALEVNTISGSVILGSLLESNKISSAQVVVREADVTLATGDKVKMLLIGSNLTPGWFCLDKDGALILLKFLHGIKLLDVDKEV